MTAKASANLRTECVALDFLNGLDPSLVQFDKHSFLGWLEERKLLTGDALLQIRAKAKPGELETLAAQAKTLSDWFRALVKEFVGRPLPASVAGRLLPLNRILEKDVRGSRVEARDNLGDRIAGSGLKLSTERVGRSPTLLLLPIAEAMADLLCTEDFSNVRVCEGPGCSYLFIDRTGKGTRRWCSMALCGNRAKQATRRHSQEQ